MTPMQNAYMENLYLGKGFFDDVHGKHLTKDIAIDTGRLELEFFRKMEVYTKVPRSQVAGAKVITTKWIDTDKGDADTPNYRARLVGREITTDERRDLFAATPPLESLRYIVCKCASNQVGSGRFCILSSDIKRTYFYAKAVSLVFIEVPVEDRGPNDDGMVARLSLSIYGTMDAAQNLQKENMGMVSIGFKVGRFSPCNFYHPRLNITCTVHGDDFTSCGPESAIEWFEGKMPAKYESKRSILGPDSKREKIIRVLNRVLSWSSDGITYGPDQRHADIVVEEIGLKAAKLVSTPSSSTDDVDKMLADVGSSLAAAEATMYRALAARLNCLAMDRPDIQFATKEAARHMAAPTLAIGY